MARLLVCALVLCSAFSAGWAGRVSPEQWPEDVSQVALSSTATDSGDDDRIIDFRDGDDPTVKSHWALLVAGSAGWGNYRHQADVYHAYHVLRAGGYREDHIVVMAYDDIANYPDNPMPGKVFNRPGGDDVYSGVKIDYKGTDVTAETFLAVLEGDSSQVINKGTGRVIDSGPNDKVFLFYSDHGAAGVVGMPSGPFLYADQLMKSLRKKFHKRGFKEMVMYIEACESGSMFEGLLDDNMAAYVTTAANSYESSWATYCPEFFYGPATDSLVPSNSLLHRQDSSVVAPAHPHSASSVVSQGRNKQPSSMAATEFEPSSFRGWAKVLQDVWQFLQRLLHPDSASSTATASQGSTERPANADDEKLTGDDLAALQGYTPPQFTTCLGDLYSVSWMEDAEVADLTSETLLQQYKKIKMRTSQNFTYEQGSHVMQYGALDIDEELAGDYEGMLHNGSIPPSPIPSADWLEFEALQQEQYKQYSSRQLLASRRYSQKQQMREPPSSLLRKAKKQSQKKTVLQREADLMPLHFTAKHSHCPKKRAAAVKALEQVTSHRRLVDSTARSAVQQLLKHPQVGYVMMTQLGWTADAVLPGANPDSLLAHYSISADGLQHSKLLSSKAITSTSTSARANPKMLASNMAVSKNADSVGSSNGWLGDVAGKYVDMLMGYLPGREGVPLVDDWDCLRGMVKAWEGSCGQLDQYGMKHTRLFVNLCNAQVKPQALGGVLGNICAAK